MPATDRLPSWTPTTLQLLRWGPLGLVVVALAVTAGALAYGGGADPLTIGDPGPVVRWGLPLARLSFDLTAALTVGALCIAVFACSRTHDEYERAMSLAQGGGVAWTFATLVTSLLTYLDVSAVPLRADASFGEGLWYFLTNLELGQMWLMATAMIAVLSTLLFGVRSRWGIFLSLGLAFLSLWPVASLGHAAGSASHDLAVGGLTLHITGAAVWVGGLAVVTLLAVAARRDKDRDARRLALIERFSQLALISFVVVAFSGLVTAIVNMADWSQLFTTSYGLIMLFKVLLLVVLGGFGVLQRRILIARMHAKLAKGGSTAAPAAWLLGIELLVMGAVSGAAAALGRTPSPSQPVVAENLANPSPAQLLSGEELPPPFDASRLFTEWSLNPIWTTLAVLGLVYYFIGMAKLRRRGDAWPWLRAAAVTVGVVIFLYNVNGPLYVYGRFMFSFHMTEHMILSMIVPIFLVLGAPMTLLLRTVKVRKDGSMGTREWVLHVVHSKWAEFFSHPIVAGVNFAIALLTFYFTPLFRWATYDHVGHMWMIAHFLIVGYLFVESLIGDDPVRTRASYPMRLISLVLVMTFHAFFGLAVMTGTGLLVAEWYGATGRDWGPATALDDQQLGGAVAWGIGEFPTVILALLVGLQWYRSDTLRAKREDRRAVRDEDAELRAYNERFKRLAEHDATTEALAAKRDEVSE
jgi:putative copper resistance protein D